MSSNKSKVRDPVTLIFYRLIRFLILFVPDDHDSSHVNFIFRVIFDPVPHASKEPT